MEFLIALVAGLVVCEIYAWLPRISRKLLEWAVSRLRPADQERYREEWIAHFNDLPDTAAMLLSALGFCIAAHRINQISLQALHDEVQYSIEKLSTQYRSSEGKLIALERTIAEKGQLLMLEHALQEALASLRSKKVPVEQFALDACKREAEKTFENFGHTLIDACNRLRSITDERTRRLRTRFQRNRDLLKALSSEYDELKLSREARADAVQRILDEVNTLALEDGGDEEHDDHVLAMQYDRLLATIKVASRGWLFRSSARAATATMA